MFHYDIITSNKSLQSFNHCFDFINMTIPSAVEIAVPTYNRLKRWMDNYDNFG